MLSWILTAANLSQPGENLQFVKLYQNVADVIENCKTRAKHISNVWYSKAATLGLELVEAFKRLGKEVP